MESPRDGDISNPTALQIASSAVGTGYSTSTAVDFGGMTFSYYGYLFAVLNLVLGVFVIFFPLVMEIFRNALCVQ